MHSPEFLREATAEHDAANPDRNIIGYTEKSKPRVREVLNVLPAAAHNMSMPAKEAELVKYAGNIFLYWKVLFANILYDLSNGLDVDYEVVKNAMSADPRIGKSHMDPVHVSGHMSSGDEIHTRGAGGHCFIKDFEAFLELYKKNVGDKNGVAVLESLRDKNIELLIQSGKDIDLLKGVYGVGIVK